MDEIIARLESDLDSKGMDPALKRGFISGLRASVTVIETAAAAGLDVDKSFAGFVIGVTSLAQQIEGAMNNGSKKK